MKKVINLTPACLYQISGDKLTKQPIEGCFVSNICPVCGAEVEVDGYCHPCGDTTGIVTSEKAEELRRCNKMIVPRKVIFPLPESWATEKGNIGEAFVEVILRNKITVEASVYAASDCGCSRPVVTVNGSGTNLQEALNSFLEALKAQGGKVIEWVEL